MKKLLLFTFIALLFQFTNAQNVGDTIKVKAFNYQSLTRDTLVAFPNNPSLTFEKIILKYNMRCKNGLVSTGTNRNLGCGEWDYSCNTYVADSSKIEKVGSIQKDYVVSNFTGSTYPYTTQTTYNHYDYIQKIVVVNSNNSESLHVVGSNTISISNLLKTNAKTGRSQVLVTATELAAAGLTAGTINAITLNVTNSGGLAKFFRVQMRNSSLTTLQAKNANFTALTEVFFRDYSFVNGANVIQFYTPFNWDGTSSVLLDISFSNSTSGTPIEFEGHTNSTIRTLTASTIYSADLSYSGLVELNNQFLNTINNQISISFWAKGDADLMPSRNSILYGSSDNDINKRQLNLHLPWEGSIYFDCGNVSNAFDRIDKPYANFNEIAGVWNHWTFTKNATTGNMNIYLNGVLWHSGTGKTKVISIMNLILGKIPTETNSDFKGKIKELSIWNSELAVQTIIDWKNKTIDATHPNYSSLVAYYKFDEATGQVITDSKNNITSTGENLKWDYERGNQLTTTFTESNAMPKITFHEGNYDLTVTDVVERYSHPKIARTVRHFSITSNDGVTPMANDVVNLLSTNDYFDATPENVYDGDSGTVMTTLPVISEGSIVITNLNYFKRYPFYNELVSFVTPYGIGLNLGMNGKSWYFDMSDYVKILKGNKRIVMALGGEKQEEMDMEFLFIVGTPPRNIVQFEQLWQGTNRTGQLPIAGIVDGTAIAPNNFAFSPDATSFKLKSSISGHGSEGEFGQNGGNVSHRIRINNVQKFLWTLTQLCAENPIFPQGGTWVYNRQGWCPGQRSLLKEQDLTPHVTPGTTMEVKYITSNPSVTGGDYRYHVAHQIVGYGAPNFTNDAAIVTIKQPNNTNAEFSRVNPMCEKPKITVRNTGSNPVTTINIEYWLNNASTHQTYTWSGTLASMADVDIVLPLNALWSTEIQATGNKFNAKIMLVNGAADQYTNNNLMTSQLTLPDVVPSVFKISIKTNNSPSQNNYTLYDAEGTIVDTKTFPTANTIYTFTYQAPQISSGCYRLRVNDTGKDGLQWWANTAQGTGCAKLLDANDVVLKTFNPDFGGGFDYSFSVDTLLANEIFEASEELKVYPNPTKGSFSIEGNNLVNSKITIYDILGNLIQQFNAKKTLIQFNETNLSAGVYFINIEKNNKTTVKKLVIN
jgi:hypothetical protein